MRNIAVKSTVKPNQSYPENEMKSNESLHIERARRALATLRQKVEAVMKLVPDLMSVENLSSIPREKRASVKHQLLSIFFYGECYVEKVMSDLSAPMISVKNKKLFDYHQNTYKPFQQQIRALIDVSNLPSRGKVEKEIVLLMEHHKGTSGQVIRRSDIEQYMNFYEKFLLHKNFVDLGLYQYFSSSSGKNSSDKYGLESIIDVFSDAWLEMAAEDMDDDQVEMWEEGIDSCEQMIRKPYFDPDSWAENEADLFPIFVTDEMKQIPTHVQKRIDEIHRSFIFGNWMAAIALSRCLLEYALIHKKSLFEKLLNRKIDIRANNMRVKSIRELVSIAAEAFPELEESMDIVVEYGNNVMHPFRRVIPSKNHAKQCAEEINKIVGVLYGQPKHRPSSQR